jgi:hypothetical protein
VLEQIRAKSLQERMRPEVVSGPVAPMQTPLLDAALRRAEAHARMQREVLVASQSESLAIPTGRAPEQPISSIAGSAKPENPTLPPAAFPLLVEEASRGSSAEAGPRRVSARLPLAEQLEAPDIQALVSAPAMAVPPDPAFAWVQALERLRDVARNSANLTGPSDLAGGWKERAQIVEWLASETPRPAGMAVLTGAVAAMADAAVAPVPDGSTRAAQIRSAVQVLEDRVPLAVAHLRLCRRVLGFGAFEPLEPSELRAGKPAILYCEMTGVRYETKDAKFVSHLYSRVELLSTRDNTKIWEQALGEAEDQCRTRRRDYYVNYRICLPASVAPGEYRLRLNQTDLVARQTASAELRLTVTR